MHDRIYEVLTLLRSKHKRFKDLTYEHFNSLYRMACARLGNAEDAEDVMQETYLKAFRAVDTFKEGTNVKAWLAQILINTIRDHIRKESRALPVVSLEEHGQFQNIPDNRSPGPEQELSDKELSPDLLQALRSLPDIFLTPLLARELNGLSYQEIADALDIPIGTVMSRLSRARNLLRKFLEDPNKTYPSGSPTRNTT